MMMLGGRNAVIRFVGRLPSVLPYLLISLFVSREALAAQRDDPYSFIHTALKEGEVLYERRAA